MQGGAQWGICRAAAGHGPGGVRGAAGEGDGAAGFEPRDEVEAVPGSITQVHIPDEQRPIHPAEDQGVAGDPRGDGRHVVPEAVDGSPGIPQELPAGDVVPAAAVPEPRGADSEREGVEAGAQGAVQELQRHVRRHPQDAEHVGGERRAAAV